jgi:hypothetical protein
MDAGRVLGRPLRPPDSCALSDLANTLCHCTTAEAAFQHIIPTGFLRMSAYSAMRDPLENRELHISAASSAPPEESEADNTLMTVVKDGIDRVRDATRLLSFTIDATEGYTMPADLPFIRAWARARMWEQYGDNHAGVCIALNRERAVAHIRDHLRGQG